MSHPFAETHDAALMSVGRVEDWNEGQVKEVKVHKKPMSVGKLNGKFFVINSVCPHMGGPLSCGSIQDGKLYCPWHEWGFDVETGECSNGHRVETYRILVEDGEVKVGWVIRKENGH